MAARVIEPLAETGETEALARRTATEDGGGRDFAAADVIRQLGHVAVIRHTGEAVGEDVVGRFIDLGHPHRLRAERMPRYLGRTYASADGPKVEHQAASGFRAASAAREA